MQAFRWTGHQRRKRIDILRQGLPQRRDGGPLIGEHGFLLRDIEIGPRSGAQPLLNGIEDATGAGDIAFGGPDTILRSEHLEIGVGDTGQRRQGDNIAIKSVRRRGLFGGKRSIAILPQKSIS